MGVGNKQFSIPTGKVGEVFSTIAKAANSRAESNLEIVQLLKASVSHQQPGINGTGMATAAVGGKGIGSGASKKKKHHQASSTAAK